MIVTQKSRIKMLIRKIVYDPLCPSVRNQISIYLRTKKITTFACHPLSTIKGALLLG